MKLEGQRIILTRVDKSAMDFAVTVFSSPDLWPFEEDNEWSREEAVKRLEEHIGSDSAWDFIITRRDDPEQKPVGIAQIWVYTGWRKSYEIGYLVLPRYQGNGFCTESVRLLLRFAFDRLGAHKVVGMCNAAHAQSAAVMERAGMVMEGVFREEYLWKGRWADQRFYSVLEREYREMASRKKAGRTRA